MNTHTAEEDTMIGLMIGIAAALGCIALALALFVMEKPARTGDENFSLSDTRKAKMVNQNLVSDKTFTTGTTVM